MNYLERASALCEEMVTNRRYVHKNAEVGMHLPITTQFVMDKLVEMGYTPKQVIDSGITATVGKGAGKVILLRADMDALPRKEDCGRDFSAINGNAHACGHDLHTAMLRGAARMLKENEDQLAGTVKLMFQPGEEVFGGSKAMIEAGILENPKVDAAFAVHASGGNMPLGLFMYNAQTTMMFSALSFRINILGKGGQTGYPHLTIDPINIGAHIYLGLQELVAREADPLQPTVLALGAFNAGSSTNSIPDTAVLQGTLRTNTVANRDKMKKRIEEIAVNTAATYRGTASFDIISESSPLICSPEFTTEAVKYISELPFQGLMSYPKMESTAGEDFAEVLQRVPGAFIFISAGFPGGKAYSNHHPQVVFNEEVLPFGAAMLAHVATRWLSDHQNLNG